MPQWSLKLYRKPQNLPVIRWLFSTPSKVETKLLMKPLALMIFLFEGIPKRRLKHQYQLPGPQLKNFLLRDCNMVRCHRRLRLGFSKTPAL
jgi:hypothetical protein